MDAQMSEGRGEVILRRLILPILKLMPQSWQTRSLYSIARFFLP
jgi:hypothetical protein